MTSSPPIIDPLLLAGVKILTFRDGQGLTNASGFFFAPDERLFLVTSRHVLWDAPSEHYPDLIRIELHSNDSNLAQAVDFAIPLYSNEKSVWRQGNDAAGDIDVAVVEIDRSKLPEGLAYRAFTPAHLLGDDPVEVGAHLLIVGFPLGFHDTLHHLPVARHAILASCYSLRFQGQGYFLTDARTHRGTSGAPVVMRSPRKSKALGDLPWILMGIHSARLDVGSRDWDIDEALGLNCAWFADMLATLTAR